MRSGAGNNMARPAYWTPWRTLKLGRCDRREEGGRDGPRRPPAEHLATARSALFASEEATATSRSFLRRTGGREGSRDHLLVLGDQDPHNGGRRSDVGLPQVLGERPGRRDGGPALHGRAGTAIWDSPLPCVRLLVLGLRGRDLWDRGVGLPPPRCRDPLRGHHPSVGGGPRSDLRYLAAERGHTVHPQHHHPT